MSELLNVTNPKSKIIGEWRPVKVLLARLEAHSCLVVSESQLLETLPWLSRQLPKVKKLVLNQIVLMGFLFTKNRLLKV